MARLCNSTVILLRMIRFIFYTLIAYVLFKIFRVVIDPLFEKRPSQQPPRRDAAEKKGPGLGEYVDYEEVK
jgi:hypothetical protein